MGDFREVAERLLSILEEMKHNGGIRDVDLPNIINDCVGKGEGQINCFPGVPGFGCCDLSFFLSLNSPSYKKGRGHLNCRKAMEKIVQHMQGACFQKTRVAVFITDNWDATAFEEWSANLEQISRHAHIEIYLLTGQAVSEIHIN